MSRRALIFRSRAGWFLTGLLVSGCYSSGDGTAPPLDDFYYPVGLRVSAEGTVLYAINSDFDLQYNGGTVQSYDLRKIRADVLKIEADPTAPDVPLLRRDSLPGACPSAPPLFKSDGSGQREPLGEACVPPVDSRTYVRSSAVVGAFATDLMLTPAPAALPGTEVVGSRSFDRLFSPIRGDASLTWLDVERDVPNALVPSDPSAFYAPWILRCGQGSDARCDAAHRAGTDPNEPGNTRQLTMPGEPFAMAMSQDGQSLTITHQSDTKTSLFSTGLSRGDAPSTPPALQFILDGLATGGAGIATIPRDPDAYVDQSVPNPAYLETSRSIAQLTLLRQYPDEYAGANLGSSLRRPFLAQELVFPITVLANPIDSRGVAIDETPRLRCKAAVAPVGAIMGRTQSDVDRDTQACAQRPARLFIANRSPASLLIGSVGGLATDGTYNGDRITVSSSIPLSAGPSRVYVAPVVERDGAYGVRVFVTCFDSATIFIYDPELGVAEQIVRVGAGPYAMAFDPFSFADMANHQQVPFDPAVPSVRRYRFAYVASFTNSFVQVIDLDDAANPASFEQVVFSLGEPLPPKGS